MFALNSRLFTVILPPSLPPLVRKFNPEDFRRGQRSWAKWKLKWDYPRERIKSSRELASEQAVYFTEHMIKIPENDKKQATEGALLVKNAPTDSDGLAHSDVETETNKNTRKALIRMSNACANHTSSTYNYTNALNIQKSRIQKFREAIKSSWPRILR